jgi:ribulose-phosphate 3-epimerase
MTRIAPSILSADFAHLGRAVAEAEAGDADWIHVDVMDGRFVPNISMGLVVVEALRRITRLPLDVHLMIVEPEKFAKRFVEAGADRVSFHLEATPHPHRLLQQIHDAGGKAGIAINPGTPVALLEDLASELDQILVMSVNPGFSGQRFIPRTLKKLKEAKGLLARENPEALVVVDGGINPENAADAVRSGADVLVAASSVYNQRASVKENLEALRRAAASAF